ncbi:non-ribosomal peptide synthetase [Vallitalea guaymasensis]|uniref:non-ribosomal peptide synthetase n=1 Tax=Vallitalea guaymasensis TaxID=1185412 RepID=UPI000DE450C0|nr:non-ribosomal peptide synthetase [Vallitalea guaymasensis]
MPDKLNKDAIEDIISLTGMQEGLLVNHIRKPSSKQYFDQITLHINGYIDQIIMKKAWEHVCQTNEVLRSIFRWNGLKQPVQIILKEKEVNFNVIDIDELHINQKIVIRTMEEDKARLSLEKNPYYITLCRFHQENVLILSAHRILFDGWSNAIIIKELFENYKNILDEKQIIKNKKTVYKEFIRWYHSQDIKEWEHFWEDYLMDYDTKTVLPFRKYTYPLSEYSSYKVKITQPMMEALKRLSEDNNITFATLIFTVWGIILQQYNNVDDVVFGTTVAGRPPSIVNVDKIVGLFINTIPIRIRGQKDQKIIDLLKEIEKNSRKRNDYQHCPISTIKKCTQLGQQENLFDSIVVIENYPIDNMSDNDILSITDYKSYETTNFDLTLQVTIEDEASLIFHYDRGLFDQDDINRLATYFLHAIHEIINKPYITVKEICLLDKREEDTIIKEFNNNKKAYPNISSIPSLIEEVAINNPIRQAVQFKQKILTYSDINNKANQLARLLIDQGMQDNDKVILMMPRSIEAIIGILAILKVGAICIPLDISHPDYRINYIINDSQAKFILKDKNINKSLDTSDLTMVTYKTDDIDNYMHNNLNRHIMSTQLAFIMYTSGSTGNPKGSMLTHKGVICHAMIKKSEFNISEKDCVANNFSLNVIASLWQIFTPLFSGGKVVVHTEDIETDPYKQLEAVAKDGVTVLELIPSILNTYLFQIEEKKDKIELPNLRYIGLTSEETKASLVNKFYSKYSIPLINCYGQTECSDDVIHYHIPIDTDTKRVLIGYPSMNTTIYIVSSNNQIQPIGFVGEICVSSDGVSKGYWNRYDLTQDKFVVNPFEDNKVMYRTGDLGRWLPDGSVEYLGRLDHQVKIRGNRIELREIENIMANLEDIQQVSVIVKTNNKGEKYLSAFFTSSLNLTVKDIRKFLLEKMPSYMIPVEYMQLDSFPITPNGKIDKKQLLKMGNDLDIGNVFVAPRDELEEKIAEIWRTLLQKDRIGMDDNFFDLGGHSLLLVKLKTMLEKRLNQEIPILDIFNYPTIHHLAEYIRQRHIPEKKMKQSSTDDDNRCLDEIAIIGIAMRVPGAEDKDMFWDNLMNKTESIQFYEDEWKRNAKDDGKYILAGGVLEGIDLFDAKFFHYSPKEAELMDPQHRIFLEHCWMAVEDAGYNIDNHNGTIGVFAGTGYSTYLYNNIMRNHAVVDNLGELQTMICNDKDYIASKVAYKLNLTGPSINLQSACSSSLVAIHYAKESILNNECNMALAGGVYIKVPQKSGYLYTEGGHMSPDGHCYPFDSRAKGTVFSNGVGVVLLKRLSEAIADHDHIYGVIKGSAVNNDGALRMGFTSPSEKGQLNVIRKAIDNAGILTDSIEYIETHGTGTPLGDPIEFKALTKGYANEKKDKPYCALGSVKSNIGHLDVAAGVIGLIKLLLALHHKIIPPMANFEYPNPLLDIDNSPFYVNTSPLEWKIKDHPRRGAISSFGIGGTNVHMILEEAPNANIINTTTSKQLILLSAETEKAIEDNRQALLHTLEKNPAMDMESLAYTLQVGRKRFKYGLMFTAKSIRETIEHLQQEKNLVIKPKHQPTIAYVFSDSFNDWTAIKNLYDEYKYFHEIIDKLNGMLNQHIHIDIPSYITSKLSKREIDNIMHEQVVICIIQIALVQLWDYWGVNCDGTIGYGIGRYAASYCMNKYTIEDIINLLSSDVNEVIDYQKDNESVGDNKQDIHSYDIQIDMGSQNEDNILFVLGKLWLSGVNINWNNYHQERGRRIPLPSYSFQRKSYWIHPDLSSKKNNIIKNEGEQWLYIPVWKQSILPISSLSKNKKTWLIFSENDNLDKKLEDYLTIKGHHVISVRQGLSYYKLNSREYIINNQVLDDYIQLLKDIKESHICIHKILHLWSLDTCDVSLLEDEHIEIQLDKSIFSIMLCVKALEKQLIMNHVDMWVISNHLSKIESNDEYNPIKAVIPSACRVISQEYQNIICKSIDIGNYSILKDDDRLINRIICEAISFTQEGEIAYRNYNRWVRTYEQSNAEWNKNDNIIHEQGVYMIIGGLGKIGLELAYYLGIKYQARLVLVHHNDIPPKSQWDNISQEHECYDKIDQLNQLSKQGVEYVLMQADCSDLSQMEKVFNRTEDKFAHIDGIIHAAGVTRREIFKPISNITKEDCLEQFIPKLKGSMVIQQCIQNRSIDFCTFFSSISSFMGGLNFFGYSISNGFLDHLAMSSDNENLMCINWGAWDINSSADDSSRTNKLNKEKALEAFIRATGYVGYHKQLIIPDEHFEEQMERWLTYTKYEDEPAFSDEKTPQLSSHSINSNEIENTIIKLMEEFLGVEVTKEDDFFALGGHSLMATKFVSRIRHIFKVDYSLYNFLDHSSVDSIVKDLVELSGVIEQTEAIARLYNEANNR